MANVDLDLGRYQLGWSDAEDYVFKPKKGLSEDIVREMSSIKGEPEWMRDFRLKSLKRFERKPMAEWFAVNMPDLDFDDIYYYVKPTESQVKDWADLPEAIKNTYERLGIPEAERKYLAGVTAQYECLRGSTQVWTTRGMRAIKELVPGDVVFALDFATERLVEARVLASGQSGEKEVYEVRAGGRSIAASANHPFLVRRREPGRCAVPRWVPLEELRVGDLVAVATDVPDFGEPFALVTPDGGVRTTNDDLCWWLGLYTASGHVEGLGGSLAVHLRLDRSDAALAAEVCRVGREQLGVEFVAAADGLGLVARGASALSALLELNGFGAPAEARRVPAWLYALPRSQRLAFLAGVLDASNPGALGPCPRRPSELLVDDLEELLALCGIDARPSLAGGPPRSRTSWATLDELLGASGRIPARSARRRAATDRRRELGGSSDPRAPRNAMVGFVRVDAIEPVGTEPVYDLSVAGHHNFVAEGFVVHNSEVVFHRNRLDLEAQGVLFCDMDTAVREYPDIVRRWFGTVIPPGDNKFAALNSAVWSGGSFIYVPPGVKVDMPLQAYFRINAENMGQFERTLIIADEGAQVHYVEGCSAPVYSTDSLHSAVVELVALPGSRITYTTIQNWSTNVYNLVTKRARAEAEAHVEWIDGNIGCLAQGSVVTTPGGTKPIELVSPGDQVLSYDERAGQLVFRTVTAKRFSGYQAVRVVRCGERRLRVTDHHPFLSLSQRSQRSGERGGPELAYVRADQLQRAVIPVSSLDYGHPHKLERGTARMDTAGSQGSLASIGETTKELMWLFGVFASAGSIDRRPARVGSGAQGVTFSVSPDSPATARLVSVMGRLVPEVEPAEGPNSLRWSDVELAEALEANGFSGPAADKGLPAWVLDVPEDQRIGFVAGFLDAAGAVSSGGSGFSIASAHRPLLEDLARVLTSLGIPARLTTGPVSTDPAERIEPRACGEPHRLEVRADWRLVAEVSEALRQALQAPASQDSGSTAAPGSLVEVHDVEIERPLVHAPTWDIEVEGTGNFVSEGFIVHNSRLTMKYPSVYLVGPKASGEVLSVAYAGVGQHQDAGAKMFHVAPETTSTIVSKSISKDGGRTTYRGKVHVDEGAKNAKAFVRCDALLLDDVSISETKPYMEVGERDASIGHEATVSKIGEDQLFYLMSRGLSESQAMGMIVNGFIEPVTRTLPMEYAVEWSRLIELQMEGSVG